MFRRTKISKSGNRTGRRKTMQLHRWSRRTSDLAMPLPPEMLRRMRITGPCTLTSKVVGSTLILKKKGSPVALRIRINGAAV